MKRDEMIQVIKTATAAGVVVVLMLGLYNPFNGAWYTSLITSILTIIILLSLGAGLIKLINKTKVGG